MAHLKSFGAKSTILTRDECCQQGALHGVKASARREAMQGGRSLPRPMSFK
jgi:hypothetical protein